MPYARLTRFQRKIMGAVFLIEPNRATITKIGNFLSKGENRHVRTSDVSRSLIILQKLKLIKRNGIYFSVVLPETKKK